MSIEIPGEIGTKLTSLDCLVERVIFPAKESGYSVIEVRPASCRRGSYSFTAKGTIGSIREKEKITLSGEWIESKYGVQLQVSEVVVPDLSGDNVYELLIGGFIKGLGPKLGQLIWDTFAEETVRIFEEDPHRLLEIKGIKEAKLSKLKEAWDEVCGKRVALVEFRKMGLHAGQIKRIFERWANPYHALQNILDNPFLLAWEIAGIGFHTADEAARRLGFEFDCRQRIDAGLGFVLHEASTKQGHCFLLQNDLFAATRSLLGHDFDDQYLISRLTALQEDHKIAVLKNRYGEKCVYLIGIARAEMSLARRLRELNEQSWFLAKDLLPLLSEFERSNNLTLHEDQKKAVILAAEHQCAVITGGPGTGKTTIIKALLFVMQRRIRDLRVGLAAPTGRAAKRMSESTGFAAQTIHRLLGYSPMNGYEYNAENTLPQDLLIIDESSMLDLRLAQHLLDAVRRGGRIIFVGDVNQLPSVGAGSVLKDIIQSETVPVARLSQIYRQSEGSYIALNAKAILNGQYRELNLSNQTDDFFFIGHKNPKLNVTVRQNDIRAGIIKCLTRLLAKGYDLKRDIQILCPMRDGALGVKSLNALLQKEFNPTGELVYEGAERIFRVGDKIMQIKNNYNKDVFNGDQGVILGLGEKGALMVDFEGREVEYKKNELDELSLAYAITVHKAQGSEAKAAIVVLSCSHFMMLSRSIFYTAVTRAKNMCVLIGEISAIQTAIKNNKVHFRNTNLQDMLTGKIMAL